MAYFLLGRLCTYRTLKHHQINPIIAFISTNKISTGIQPFLQSENLVKQHQTNLQPAEDGYKYAQRILSSYDADLFSLVESDIKDLYVDIIKELSQHTNNSELLSVATYYFNGQGKAGLPTTMFLMARAINNMKKTDFLPSQRQLAQIVEMIYRMGGAQDDVCDFAVTRSGQTSINLVWKNYKQIIIATNYVSAVAIIMASRLRNDDVTIMISKLVSEVIHGELLQAGFSKEGLNEAENKGITQHLNMINLKTGSLVAIPVKAASVLAGADEELSEIAFQYGRNIGLVFQLMDDYVDFVSDMKVGLPTAPVFFACEEFPELNEMIKRKFEDEGDVEKALEMVRKSKGLEQTQLLAKKYCSEAVRLASSIKESPYQKGLTIIPHIYLNRK